MNDLRDRIAETIARTHTPTTATVHPLMEDYRPHADAVMRLIETELLSVISALENLIGRATKTSVRELSPDLAYRILCLTGCIECGEHPGTHCDWCHVCPCECGPEE